LIRRNSCRQSKEVVDAGHDEKTNRFELKAEYPLAGETWRQRTVIERSSADTMIAASYLSFGKVPEWKAVEIKYSRTTK
jgi:hypothetical protein